MTETNADTAVEPAYDRPEPSDSRTLITCPPGYFVLRAPGVFEGESNLRRSAIVAWDVYEGSAHPVTADPSPSTEELAYAVEFPDGHVEAQNTSWKNVRQYCASNNLGPVEILDE